MCSAVAGVYPTEDIPLWALPLERWTATIAANLTVTFLTARAFMRAVEGSGTPRRSRGSSLASFFR